MLHYVAMSTYANSIELDDQFYRLLWGKSTTSQDWRRLAQQIDACADNLVCVAAAQRRGELRERAKECRDHMRRQEQIETSR